MSPRGLAEVESTYFTTWIADYCTCKTSFWCFSALVSGRGWDISPWSGAQKSPAAQGNLWLSGFIQRSTSASLLAWAAAWQQAISCKCPQLEEQYFRNGPDYRGFNALIGQREPALSYHVAAFSFLTRSTINSMDMCRWEAEPLH